MAEEIAAADDLERKREYQFTNREAIDEALRLLLRAIELDPTFASAHGAAAWCYAQRKLQGWVADRVRETAEAARLARRAVELSKDDAAVLSSAAWTLALVVRDLDAGFDSIDRALVLNPNLAPEPTRSGHRLWATRNRSRSFLRRPL
jgi:tetratricopeptide (TPR) repeat protein